MYWSLRREQLCDPKLCADAPEDGGRCDACPLNKLDAAEESYAGQLLRRVLDLRAAARMGIQIGLADIAADEFGAMAILDDENAKLASEQDR